MNAFLKHALLFVLLVPSLLPREVVADSDCLILGTKKENYQIIDHARLSEALNRANICHQIRMLPGKRGTLELRDGVIDGEIGRIDFYLKEAGDIIVKVDWPLVTGQGLLITKDPTVTSIRDLRGKGIASVIGNAWGTEVLKKHVPALYVSSKEQLAMMLAQDRISGFITDNHWWDKKKYEYPEFHDHVIYNGSLYLWLLVEHKEKAVLIKTALDQYIQENGEFRLGIKSLNIEAQLKGLE